MEDDAYAGRGSTQAIDSSAIPEAEGATGLAEADQVVTDLTVTQTYQPSDILVSIARWAVCRSDPVSSIYRRIA